jgi:hypothetical protein
LTHILQIRAYFILLCLSLLVAVPSSVASSAQSLAAHPLVTAIDDPQAFADPQADIALARTRAAGATMAKVILFWDRIAPAGEHRPAGFDATNPADPAYDWAAFDSLIKTTVAQGLEPLVAISGTPAWADRPPGGRDNLTNWNVDAGALADFAEAAARRYGGTFQGLPRVRYWQVWNEPNLSVFLNPQLRTQLTQKPSCPFAPSRVVSDDVYRRMVNAAAEALHRIRFDNIVIAGGLSPFCGTSGVVATAPLLFMRKLLCMSDDPVPRPTCSATVKFDIWATHPYTAGGPTHEALRPDDVSIGDLPEMRRLLRAAVKARHVVSRRSVRFWVTEFGWDTKPPDGHAVPLRLHARWVAEALYRMWQDGITLVTWFALRDEAANRRAPGQTIQSGLYFRRRAIAQDRPKPSLAAFRFPFVAFPSNGKIFVWGRTPWGKPGAVVVEQSSKHGWRAVAHLSTDRYGIFRRRVAAVTPGDRVRARLLNESRASIPFSLVRPPDLLVNPFGGPYLPIP